MSLRKKARPFFSACVFLEVSVSWNLIGTLQIMNDSKKEIMTDLLMVLDKMVKMEEKEGVEIFSDDAFTHLSYAMEHISGIFGGTDKQIERFKPEFLKNKN